MTAHPHATDIAELVADHHAALFGYAFRLSGSEVDAEDLVQQVFLIAYRKLDQLRDPIAARSWLFTILRRCFSKSLQRRKPWHTQTVPLDIENLPEPITPQLAIDQEELQQALDELPPKHRLVLVMFYFEDCSYREIAEQLDIPLGTVMSRLARAKAQLKTQLSNQPAVQSSGNGKN